ncbi:MAG TPA: Hint domain-containing protein, partial [Acetobacteraceae bacterium]|nr:Hint domain-containing protein [Acetobacteraceae bacterium]
VPDTVTDWAGTIAAAQFDPELGTLKAVSLQLIGELDSSTGIENLGTAASDFNINQAAFVSLVVPGTTEVVSASPDSVSSVLGGFDGVNDFAGPSGQTQSDIISTGTIVDNLTNALDLDAFAGSGTIDLGVSSHGTADATVPGNSLLKLGGLAGATIELSYLYLPTAAADDQGGILLSDFGPDALPVVGTPEFSTVSVDPACFARATRIATENGQRAVETLAMGDRVLLARGGSAPIIWVGRRKVDCRRHPDPAKVQPVRIKAHAFGKGRPARDLLLSPDHAIYAEGVLIPVKCLVNDTTVLQQAADSIEYWHLELARHDLILAENLAAESLLDTGNKAAFENGGTSVQLYPDFAALRWEAAGCAPLKVVGREVDQTRARLLRTAMKAVAANRAARAG